MKIKNLFLLFFLALNVVKADRRIYGGKSDDKNFFEHHVYLSILTNDGGGLCGASAIDKNWIITAAHCILKGIKEIKAFENPKIRPIHTDSGHLIHPENIFVHEDYDDFQFINDIALIYVEEGLQQKTIQIIDPDSELTEKLAKIGGFGSVNDEAIIKDHFEFVELPIVKGEECEKTYQRSLWKENEQLCIKASDKMSPCRGDSGGGLVTTIDNENYLIGLVSYGAVSCEKGYPIVFTKVSGYLDWINEKMQ